MIRKITKKAPSLAAALNTGEIKIEFYAFSLCSYKVTRMLAHFANSLVSIAIFIASNGSRTIEKN